MNKDYICYCGLYCGNCAVMAKMKPAAEKLYGEMIAAGFDEIIHFIPGGDGFWPFLKDMAEKGLCGSCKEGSGNPGCGVRICAKEKGVDTCALCEKYPCALFDEFFANYPTIKSDNALLKEKGFTEWGKLQDEREKKGFTYSDDIRNKNPS